MLAVQAPGSETSSIVISFAQKTYTNGVLNSKLHVIELGAQPGMPDYNASSAQSKILCRAALFRNVLGCATPRLLAGSPPLKKQAELFFPPEFADDFPVAMQISQKYGLVYVVTKLGLLFVYDLETATAVYRNRISPDPIFLTAAAPDTGGFYAINRWRPSPNH